MVREKRGRVYKIPVKDGREFIVAQKLWENSKHEYFLYLFLGLVFILSFIFLEYISGEAWKASEYSFFTAIFLIIGILSLMKSLLVYRRSDVKIMERRFMKDFTGRRRKQAMIMASYWIDSEYNDTSYDYLILKIDMLWYAVEVYVRGDIVHDIAGFIHPDMVKNVNLEEVLKRIDIMVPAAIQPRKNALVFARQMLMYHREEFIEAFLRQPMYSLRYIEKIAAEYMPTSDRDHPVEPVEQS